MDAKYSIATASKEELMLIEGVSEMSALAIIDCREHIGKITSWNTFKALAPKTSLENILDLHESREWTSDIKEDFPYFVAKRLRSISAAGSKQGPVNSPVSPPSNLFPPLHKDWTDPNLTSSFVDQQEVKPAPVPGGSNSSNIDSHYLNFGSKFSNLVNRKLVRSLGRRSMVHSPHLKHQVDGKSAVTIEKPWEGDLSRASGNVSADGNLSPAVLNMSADGGRSLTTKAQLVNGTLNIQLPEKIINAVTKIALYKSTGCESNVIHKDSSLSAIPSDEDSSCTLPSDVSKTRPWKPRNCFECKGAGHLAPHCPTRRRRSILCFECGGAGHPAPECPSRRLSSIVCYQCGGHGHIAKNCSFHHHPASHLNSRHILSIRCYNCRDYGHIARNCSSSTLRAFNPSSYYHGATNYNSSLRRLPNQDFKTGSDSQDWRATMRGRI